MPLNIETLETFVGTRLQFMDESLSRVQHLTFFDGFVHWDVMWDHEREWLRIAAVREPSHCAFSIVEVERNGPQKLDHPLS